MNIHERLRTEQQQKEKEKELKRSSLEKQLKKLELRQKDLRSVALTALDPAFVRRQLDKCEEEKKQINQLLADL